MPPIAPMLAKAVPSIPPTGSYEPKWDGFRSIIFRDGDEIEIGSRNERPMTRYFPELVAAFRSSLTRMFDGAATLAVVHVERGPSCLNIEVLDNGSSASDAGAAGAAPQGFGLIGMRERVDLYDGTLTAGFRPEGGFRVNASIPLGARS